jgi:hypothetical protein
VKNLSFFCCRELDTTGTGIAKKTSHNYQFGDTSDEISSIQQIKIIAD